VPTIEPLAVGGSSHLGAMIDVPPPGEACGDPRAQTMNNAVATVDYTIGFPQPFAETSVCRLRVWVKVR
jgi:hypothetical protein